VSSSLGHGERQDAQRRRRAPAQVTHLIATYGLGGQITEAVSEISGPIHIALETTDEKGRVAAWFHDDWFTKLLNRFGDEFVTLRVAPTPGALVHPTVLHESEMARRVVPHWRVIGTGYVDDIQSDSDIAALANGPYHEVQFFDHARAGGSERTEFATHLSVEKLFVQLRKAQGASAGRSPTLVRLPARIHRASPLNETAIVDPPRTQPTNTIAST